MRNPRKNGCGTKFDQRFFRLPGMTQFMHENMFSMLYNIFMVLNLIIKLISQIIFT